jgi:hypothetical protein
MAKAHSRAGIGQGWHKQSGRHSDAKKTGHAGGVYASERIRKIVREHPEYKDLTFQQLKKKGVFLKYQKDSDGDGIANVHDCRPLNSKKQDDGEKMTEEGYQDYLNNEAEEEEQEREDNLASGAVTDIKRAEAKEEKKKSHKIRDFIHKEGEELKEYGARKKMEREIKEAYEDKKKVRELNTALKEKISAESEIDLKALSEDELKKLAVVEGESVWGDNRYESEIKRRMRAEADLQTDIILERQKLREREKERLHPKPSLFENPFK